MVMILAGRWGAGTEAAYQVFRVIRGSESRRGRIFS